MLRCPVHLQINCSHLEVIEMERRRGSLLASNDMFWFILGWNFWDWECISLTNSGCYRKSIIICIIQHVQKRHACWQFVGIWVCWGELTYSKSVILVISYLAFVFFTLAIVIVMCNPQESMWAIICHQYTICIFHLQFHLGQDDDWEQPA